MTGGAPPGAVVRTRAILCITGAMVLLTGNDAIVKALSPTYPLHEIVAARAAVGLPIVLLIMHLEGGLRLVRTRRLPLHLVRGALLVTTNTAFFLGVAAIPLGDATALFFVAPLVITVLSIPVLGEQVGPLRWAAVLAGLVGVLLVMKPGVGVFQMAALLPVLAALTYAGMQMLTRRLGGTERASTLAFYIQSCFLGWSLTVGVLVGHGGFLDPAWADNPSLSFLLRPWQWPSHGDAALLLACGGLQGASSYLMSIGYRSAEATVVAPFEYVALPLAVAWGFVIWGDLPDWVSVGGIGLIAGSGLFVFHRESVRARGATAQRPPAAR